MMIAVSSLYAIQFVLDTYNDIKRDSPKKENDHAMDDIRYFVSTVLYGKSEDIYTFAVERM